MKSINTDKIEAAFRKKEQAEHKRNRAEKDLNKAFEKKLSLQAELNHSDDFEKHDRIESELVQVNERISELKDALKEAEKQAEKTESEYKDAREKFLREYTKWADSHWSDLKKRAAELDEIGEQMKDVSKIVHKTTGTPTVSPTGKFSDALKGAPRVPVENSPENRLRKLKQAV